MNEKSRDTCNIGNTENWKYQRQPLQKPGMNLKMSNLDHYKNLEWI